MTQPGFIIFSQSDAKSTEEAIKFFVYLRQSLFVMAGRKTPDPPMPIYVYIFKDKKMYNAFRSIDSKDAAGKRGFFLSHLDGNYLVLNGAEQFFDQPGQTYVRYLLHTHFTNLPAWLEQGLVAYLSTLKIDDQKVTIGLPIPDHLNFLRYDAGMPYQQLLNYTEENFNSLDKKQARQWAAQSWLLVHYLFHGKEGAMRLLMEELLNNLANGISSTEALSNIYQLSSQNLQSTLSQYARQPQHGFLTIDLKELHQLEAVTAAPVAETNLLYYLGDLLAHQGEKRLPEAEEYFTAAIKLQPDFALAYSGLGFIAAQRKQSKEANEYFNKAISLNGADARSYFHFGCFLLDSSQNHIPAPQIELVLQARGYLQRAIDADDRFSEAYVQYGRTFLYDLEGSLHSGISALEMALMRLPNRFDIAIDLLCLYDLAGDTLRANYYLNDVIPKRWGQNMLARAIEKMNQLLIKRSQKWVDEGKYAQAVTMLQYAHHHAALPSQQTEIQQKLADAKQKRQVEVYHLAKTTANNGDDAKAVEYLREAIELNAEAKTTAAAKTLYAQLGKRLQLKLYSDAIMKMNDNKLKQAESLLLRVIELDANAELTNRARKLLQNVRAAM